MEAREFKFTYPPAIYSRYGFIVYVTGRENETVTRFLHDRYWQLRSAFAGKGLVFHYLSQEIRNRYEMTVSDSAAASMKSLLDFTDFEDLAFTDYLYRRIDVVRRESDSELLRYMDDTSLPPAAPSLFFCDVRTYSKSTRNVTLKAVAFNPDMDLKAQAKEMVEFISTFFPDGAFEKRTVTRKDAVSTSQCSDRWKHLYMDTRAEGYSDSQIENILRRIIIRHSISSRIVITSDYRIILEEFGGRELRLKALPKALYLFYMKHPEGVKRYELYLYMPEIAYIYFKVRTRKVADPLATIRNMVAGQQLDNNLTSIRDAFQKAYDLESHSRYSLEPDSKAGRLLVISIPKKQRVWLCPDISECRLPKLPAGVKDMVKATWEILHGLGNREIDEAIGRKMLGGK